jgi:RNA polymerase sigma factor (sigma-70 family)
MAEQDDDFRNLMRRVREGSEDAAWELVRDYGEPIRRAVRRAFTGRLRSKFDSLDFVQLVWNSFFRIRNTADRFDRPEQLAMYLVAMARNKVAIEVRRRLVLRKYNVQHEQSLGQAQADDHPDRTGRQPAPVDVAIAREQWNRMLEDQPAHYREIIHLRLQGFTCRAIAGIVHLDEGTVRRFLKKLLKTAVA